MVGDGGGSTSDFSFFLRMTIFFLDPRFFVLSEDDNFFLDMAIFHEICKKMEKELKMSHNASLVHNMTAIHMRLN